MAYKDIEEKYNNKNIKEIENDKIKTKTNRYRLQQLA